MVDNSIVSLVLQVQKRLERRQWLITSNSKNGWLIRWKLQVAKHLIFRTAFSKNLEISFHVKYNHFLHKDKRKKRDITKESYYMNKNYQSFTLIL